MDTGYLALEGRGGVSSRTVLEVFRTDGCHGAGEVALALDTITDHDGLLEELIVLFENEVENALGTDRCRLGAVSDTGYRNGGSGRNTERETAVGIGNSTKSAVTHYHDRSSDDRLAAAIEDSSTDGTVLGIGQRSHQAHDGSQDDSRHFLENFVCHKSVVNNIG